MVAVIFIIAVLWTVIALVSLCPFRCRSCQEND